MQAYFGLSGLAHTKPLQLSSFLPRSQTWLGLRTQSGIPPRRAGIPAAVEGGRGGGEARKVAWLLLPGHGVPAASTPRGSPPSAWGGVVAAAGVSILQVSRLTSRGESSVPRGAQRPDGHVCVLTYFFVFFLCRYIFLSTRPMGPFDARVLL